MGGIDLVDAGGHQAVKQFHGPARPGSMERWTTTWSPEAVSGTDLAGQRAELRAAVARWQRCADLVAGDVRRTTDLGGAWVVELREDEDSLRAGLRAGPSLACDGRAYRSHLRRTSGDPRERPRVRLLLPEIWLVALDAELLLPAAVVDVETGASEIAELVQDSVIDAVWNGWPSCPGHSHPAQARKNQWVCPSDGHRVAEIGRLGL